MATAGERVAPGGLNIAFDYDSAAPVAVGDQVEIIAARKVKKLTAAGRSNRVGEVVSVREGLYECVVATPFRHNRQDRLAGENVVIGQFVWGAANAVLQYSPSALARHDGTTTGPKTVTVDTDDTIKLKILGGASQTIVITAGVDLTFAAIAAEVNETLTDMHLEVDAAGHMNIVAEDLWKSVEVEAVATDAYTLLGWTAGVYLPSGPSHDPNDVAGLIVVGGSSGAAVETLEY